MNTDILHIFDVMALILVMGFKAGREAVYEIKYHFLWKPEYRESILRDEIEKRLKEIFRAIADKYEFAIEGIEFGLDYGHNIYFGSS